MRRTNIASCTYIHRLGATSGFGTRIASLARRDRVIATGRTKEKIDQLVLGVKPELIDNLRTVLLDVTQGEEALKIKMDKAEFWGGIDVLVNNAGKRFVNDGKIG